MRVVEKYFVQYKKKKKRWRYSVTILTVLSSLVVFFISWNLRLTGITIANGATCQLEEHQHTDCPVEKILICDIENKEAVLELKDGELITVEEAVEHEHTEECYESKIQCDLEEHLHELSCYSDLSADIETAEIWEATLPELTEDKAENLVLIAKSQLGYEESEKNYEVDDDGETRHGITRYGQWYGNPYGEWANMFTSFCLRYAGLKDLPMNSGAETMRQEWEEKGLYREKETYNALPGDIVFLNKNENDKADVTAIVIENKEEVLTVIEGDVDHKVEEKKYEIDHDELVGYGITIPEKDVVIKDTQPIEEMTIDGAEEEPVMAVLSVPDEPVSAAQVIAQTVNYNTSIFNGSSGFVLYVKGNNNKYYAIDGYAKAVEIQVDGNGNILSDVEDPQSIYWSFEHCGTYDGQQSYYIRNNVSGKYLHPYYQSNTDHGAIIDGKWESALYPNGTGVRIRGARQNSYAYYNNASFTDIGDRQSGSTFYFGKAPESCAVWFDGTVGGLMSYGGSDDQKRNVMSGSTIKLPTEWKSPEKYQYKLRGWYDVVNSVYYAPGEEVTVTGNLVFYADWVVANYDVGVYNSHVANTISTNKFITTHVFDYNVLFNMMSEKASVTVNQSGHDEKWSMVTGTAKVPYKDAATKDFIFSDWDLPEGFITRPSGINDRNNYNSDKDIMGIYSSALGNLLFSTDNAWNPKTKEGVIGKSYLGTADHLFQKVTDVNDEHYGYYYYDSTLNSSAYNQSDQRFYVYDYLERTSDSASANDSWKYSDFLPLNSPYHNTNGQALKTYSYDGVNGKYAGVQHYQYDAKYNTDESSVDNIGVNYGFGMSVDIDFYLPNDPGTKDANGDYGNKDIYGKDMHFKFSGDDDVWIFIDGKLVLDIGDIHGVRHGDINFSTGIVTYDGKQVGTLNDFAEGEHTLTIYYLERGSSQSNCSIYFNLAPRFTLDIQKEDVLTQEVLNGAEFSVYKDAACTIPCELWESEEEHKKGVPAKNTFKVVDGVAKMWGLGASNTYYIRETSPPDKKDYSCANGIIRLQLDKNGVASYGVDIIPETDNNGNDVDVSNGFTVHGFRIDEETQEAFIVVTNAQDWVEETTSVYVEKKWNDTENHTHDKVIAYLNVTNPDGTVRRIREIELSEANEWEYTWINLPKYQEDGKTEIQYSITEAYVEGYAPQIEELESGTVTETVWPEAYKFVNKSVYVLKTAKGCLSAESETGKTLKYVDEATAKNSPLALWTATVSGNNVKLTNQAGQILTYSHASRSSNRYFYVTKNTENYQTLLSTQAGTSIRIYVNRNTENYYICDLNNNKYAAVSTSTSAAMSYNPLEKTIKTTTINLDGEGYRITNVPLETETSLKVTKKWDHPTGDQSLYEKEQITVKLFANGVYTGRTVTLSLKNGWTDTFLGLPYVDDEGEVITYTVEESWKTNDWVPVYGEVKVVGGDHPAYETTVTNSYRWVGSVELPKTGGIGRIGLVLIGLVLTLGPFVYGFRLKRRHGRRRRR